MEPENQLGAEIIKAYKERNVAKITMMEAVEVLITEAREFPLTLDPGLAIWIDGPDRPLYDAFMTRKERVSAEEFFNRLAEVDGEGEPLYGLATGWSNTEQRFAFIGGIITGLVIAGKSRGQIKSILEAYLIRLADEKESEGEASIISKGE